MDGPLRSAVALLLLASVGAYVFHDESPRYSTTDMLTKPAKCARRFLQGICDLTKYGEGCSV
jgi:hypothetical protein